MFQRITEARENDPHSEKRRRLAEAVGALDEAGYRRGRGRRPAEAAGYPVHETDAVRVTEENVPHPYHGHAGGTVYYHVSVLSDRGASRGGWYKLKTYRDKDTAMEAARFIDGKLGLWHAMFGVKQFLTMDIGAWRENGEMLYGIFLKSEPKLKEYPKADVMREAERWIKAGRPPKRPFVKADDLPA